jgi:hypothetical protein
VPENLLKFPRCRDRCGIFAKPWNTAVAVSPAARSRSSAIARGANHALPKAHSRQVNNVLPEPEQASQFSRRDFIRITQVFARATDMTNGKLADVYTVLEKLERTIGAES